ncbi:hypothetical protein MBM_05315 [Drepanopeziza brunnea f. sp. 'multigermtubi' MB_m1]|uniref:Uncharacterized protein n=1 Tax=Marssonina brunnea f. sp. multigermtubi (strain MB_m1) TaxID=1072389 RepID=K1WUV2_MARBU|nr:uncharacterized protein MBM_05315 [Drepanopeziza brunnea f. sp. 'multigermtubi' MB_m1]EKD16846.1 hypothetical protein MBM_05315 [Drepanopeziza brunnea f. sp. 'multigermtubi' MB_m1]
MGLDVATSGAPKVATTSPIGDVRPLKLRRQVPLLNRQSLFVVVRGPCRGRTLPIKAAFPPGVIPPKLPKAWKSLRTRASLISRKRLSIEYEFFSIVGIVVGMVSNKGAAVVLTTTYRQACDRMSRTPYHEPDHPTSTDQPACRESRSYRKSYRSIRTLLPDSTNAISPTFLASDFCPMMQARAQTPKSFDPDEVPTSPSIQRHRTSKTRSSRNWIQDQSNKRMNKN